MTERHLNENPLLNAAGNPCCFNFGIFFPRITEFQHKKLSLFSNIILLFLISQLYFRCVKLFIHKKLCSYQICRRKYSRLFIVDLYIYHFWCHTIHCSLVLAQPLKNNVFGFSNVFSHKIVQKVEYISRTAWLILMILVSFLQDFERPFRRNHFLLAL